MRRTFERLQRHWRHMGLRVRSTAAAVAAAGLLFAIAAALVPTAVERLLITGVSDSVALRAHDIASQIAARGISSVNALLQGTVGDNTLVQVVSATNTVVASTQDVAGEAPMLQVSALSTLPSTQQQKLAFVDNIDYVIAAERAGTGAAAPVVLAAQSLAATQRSAQVFALILYGSIPALLLLIGLATWLAVGRSLRSIDAIRQRVDSISPSDLATRVPVPIAVDEVSRLAETMNRMLTRVDAAARAQRRFIADASHELRSPLATLRTAIDVRARESSTPDPQLSMMSDEVDRMSRLVGDLLLLAKMDERAGAIIHGDVDLDDLLHAEVVRLRASTALEIESNLAAARISGDPNRIAQALRNLADNAARYAAHRIRITLTGAADRVHLTFEDDGPGIPADDRTRVFERFVRLDEHRGRADGGSGLGLAITDEIVRAHAGAVTVDGSELGGARFRVDLPYADGPDAGDSSR